MIQLATHHTRGKTTTHALAVAAKRGDSVEWAATACGEIEGGHISVRQGSPRLVSCDACREAILVEVAA